MADVLTEYGVFLLELITIVVVFGGLILVIIISARKPGHGEGISIRHLNDEIERRARVVQKALLGRDGFRKLMKERAKEKKKKARRRKSGDGDRGKRIFVLDFKGDIRASATASLREEVSTILEVAEPDDEVYLRLENTGGAVHEHGLAASQLLRLKDGGLKLTVVVDKVAASGGYLMACVADRLIAAPFAIIGSIGVIAQLPNFHRFLENRGVDFEQITAGRFKRTLTVFGQNTEEGREKLKEELEDVHKLFKGQIAKQRPAIDVESVATGEHWYGTRALELELVDAIGTSDDLLLEAARTAELYAVQYRRRKTVTEKLMSGAESLLSH